MAVQQHLCFLFFLAACVSGPCTAILHCLVKDATGHAVTGALRAEGLYTIETLEDNCRASVRLVLPGYADSNVRMRILEVASLSWVRVFDGDGKLLGDVIRTYRDNNVSESFQSPNSLNISLIRSRYFKVRIEHFSVPGTPVNSSATRLSAREDMSYLTSFGYPIGYPNSLHFIYIISAEFGCLVEIIIDTLLLANSDTEADYRCSKDYVEVKLWTYDTVRWCQGGRRMVSHGSEITLIFHSDASGSQKGFQLRYRSIKGSYETTTPARSECSHSLEASSETLNLRWPTYPYYSDHGYECRWLIGTGMKSDFSVMVQVLNIDLRDGEVLQLYDGSNAEDGALLDEIHEEALRRAYHSSSSTLLVVFRSSAVQQDKESFRLSYKRVVSRNIYCNSTVIVDFAASVYKSVAAQYGFYPPFTCWYRFQASYSFHVSLLSANVNFPPPPDMYWGECYSSLLFNAGGAETTTLCSAEAAMNKFPVAERTVLVWFYALSYGAQFSFLLKEQVGNRDLPTTTAVRTQAPDQLGRGTVGLPEVKHRTYEVVSGTTNLIPPGYHPGQRQDIYIWSCNIDAKGLSKRIKLESDADNRGWTDSCDYVDVYDGAGRTDPRIAHWCGNEALFVISEHPYIFLEFRARYGTRRLFVIEAKLVPVNFVPNSGTPSALNTPEALAISGGVVVLVFLWVVFVLCVRRARRLRRLRELHSNIDRMIVLQLASEGPVVAADDTRPLLDAMDTPARPWWRRLGPREREEDVDHGEAPPPYPGLPDPDSREDTLHDPPPPYTLSAHDVSIPSSDRPFLERSRDADSSPWGEDNVAITADPSPWEEDNVAATADPSPWEEDNVTATADPSPWEEDNVAAIDDYSPWEEDNVTATADPSPWEEDNVTATADPSPWEEDNVTATADPSPWEEDNVTATADPSPWEEDNMAATADSRPWAEDCMAATADSRPWGEDCMAATADSRPWEEDCMAAIDDLNPREDDGASCDASSPAAQGSVQAESDDVPCLLLHDDDDDDNNREELIRLDKRSDVL